MLGKSKSLWLTALAGDHAEEAIEEVLLLAGAGIFWDWDVQRGSLCLSTGLSTESKSCGNITLAEFARFIDDHETDLATFERQRRKRHRPSIGECVGGRFRLRLRARIRSEQRDSDAHARSRA